MRLHLVDVHELIDLTSPTFSENFRRMQHTVVSSVDKMDTEEYERAIHFSTVYRESFEVVALDSLGFRDNPTGEFDFSEWDEAIEIATDGLGASFAAISVPVYYPEPIMIPGEQPTRNVVVMIGVERLGYRKMGMALYRDGDQAVCSGRWFATSLESPADRLIIPVRRAVAQHG